MATAMGPEILRVCDTEIYKPQLNSMFIGMQSESFFFLGNPYLTSVISARSVRESCHCALREDTQGIGSNLFLFSFFSTRALLSFALLSLTIDVNSILSKDPLLHHFRPIFLKSSHHHHHHHHHHYPSTLTYVLFFSSVLLLCFPVNNGCTTPLLLSLNISCRCTVGQLHNSVTSPPFTFWLRRSAGWSACFEQGRSILPLFGIQTKIPRNSNRASSHYNNYVILVPVHHKHALSLN